MSNDDGIDAPGLRVLAARLALHHEVWVVAPTQEQSAKSHSLTMHDPLRLYERGPQRFAVSGTPADCVYVAIHHLLPAAPDLVVSGINDGSNLGGDVHYSGTVAAAREAILHGHPAVAVSLQRESSDLDRCWDSAAALAERVVDGMDGVAAGVLLNLNVPNLPLARILGLKATPLGTRVYAPAVHQRVDPRGGTYVWIGGPHVRFEGGDHVDGEALQAGWATVTPLSSDSTDHRAMVQLRGWTDA